MIVAGVYPSPEIRSKFHVECGSSLPLFAAPTCRGVLRASSSAAIEISLGNKWQRRQGLVCREASFAA